MNEFFGLPQYAIKMSKQQFFHQIADKIGVRLLSNWIDSTNNIEYFYKSSEIVMISIIYWLLGVIS